MRADEAATAPITVVQPRVEPRPSCCGSREAVEAAEKELAGRRAQIMGPLGLTVDSADLYQAPVMEVKPAGA